MFAGFYLILIAILTYDLNSFCFAQKVTRAPEIDPIGLSPSDPVRKSAEHLAFASTLDGKTTVFATGDGAGDQHSWTAEINYLGNYTQGPDATSKRWFAAMAAAGQSKVVIFGGQQQCCAQAVFLNSYQVYDTNAHQWSLEQQVTQGENHVGPGGATAGDVAIFVGGRTAVALTPSMRVFAYNASSDTMRRLTPDLTHGRIYPASCSAFAGGTSNADRVAIFAGGIGSDRSSNSATIFDATGVSIDLTMASHHGSWSACAGIGGSAIIVGGVYNDAILSVVSILNYDTGSSMWIVSGGSSLAQPRFAHAVFAFAGSFYVAGGCIAAPSNYIQCDNATNTIEVFDRTTKAPVKSLLELYSPAGMLAWGVAGDFAFVGVGKGAANSAVRSITPFKITQELITATTATTAMTESASTSATISGMNIATTATDGASTLALTAATTFAAIPITTSTAVIKSSTNGLFATGSSATSPSLTLSTDENTQTDGATSATMPSSDSFSSSISIKPSSEATSSSSFPLVLVFAVVAGCCCCLIFGVALVMLHRRKKFQVNSSDSAELTSVSNDDIINGDGNDGDNMPYDSIVAVMGESVFRPVSDVLHNDSSYARLPGRDTVEGTYHTIPGVGQPQQPMQQECSMTGRVTILDSTNILVDTSRSIGKGEFGTVFKARYNGVDVAVKTLRNDFTEAQLQSFYDEINLVAALPTHPNLIGFVGMTPDPFMIVLEYAAHGSLLRFLRKHKDVSLAQQLSLMHDISNGCRFLAEHRIIHRDLAARNILLDADSNVKIADFGMSRTILEESSAHVSKSSIGPVKWYSIEAIKKASFSEKSDVWAFAITCHEIFNSGDEPYAGMTGIQAARKVIGGYRLEYPDFVPAAVRDLLARCMDALASKRPSFAEIYVELGTHVDCDEVPYQSLKGFCEI